MAPNEHAAGLVLLEELAVRLSRTPGDARRYALENKVVLTQDWAGREVVKASDAQRLIQTWAAEWAETRRKHDAFEAWKERRVAEHLRERRAEMEEEAAENERRIARAREEHQAEMRQRYEQQARAKAEADARFIPDTSREAFERETGG